VTDVSKESNIKVLSNLDQYFFYRPLFPDLFQVSLFCNTRESIICVLWSP